MHDVHVCVCMHDVCESACMVYMYGYACMMGMYGCACEHQRTVFWKPLCVLWGVKLLLPDFHDLWHPVGLKKNVLIHSAEKPHAGIVFRHK